MSAGEPRELRATTVYRSVLYTALLYALVAALWILLSDELVARLVPLGPWQTRLSIGKGWLFVVVTGLLLYTLLLRHARRLIDAEARYRAGLEEVERQKRVFFQNTIAAITEGKLLVRDRGDVEALLPGALRETIVQDASEAPGVRAGIRETMEALGFAKERVQDFVVAVGEAVTNAIKHAGGGAVSVHTSPECLWVRVADDGTGIADLMLPRALLERGYSTKPSLGMGYTLMLTLADRVYLSTGPTGTTLVLESCRPNAPAMHESGPASYRQAA